MKPYYQDIHDTLYCLDFRENDLPDESVQMVVTSPPYWGLRKYHGGLSQALIWGDINTYQKSKKNKGRWLTRILWRGMEKGVFNKDKTVWIGAYGLEPTPEMYIQHTIEILREIRRVLRKDGVVWWNIGDSYSGSGKGIGSDHGKAVYTDTNIPRTDWGGLKPKDLCLIPFRVAIAAQEDGWWVRSVIIWSKPNPMPESVQDRPTESHEYILMLTKNSRYYWDADAVRREYKQSSIDRADGSKVTTSNPDRPVGFTRTLANGANLRSVWDFPTQPYPEAHFAVFPEKLPELCIKAATPEVGCCSKCGKPWERIVERQNKSTYQEIKEQSGYDYHDSIKLTEQRGVALSGNQKSVGNTLTPNGKVPWYNKPDNKTVGWQQTCQCCRKCDILGLSTSERKVAHATQRPRTGEGLEAGVEQEALGNQCGTPQEEQGEATEVSEDVRPLSQGLYGQREESVLQSGLLNEMDVGEQAREPLPTNEAEQSVSIQIEQGENSKGSQAGNGEPLRETATPQRVGSSHQRGQERQSDRELDSVNEADTRSQTHQETHELEPYDKVPSTVLDPFSGAGTSLWVAKKLNRQAIGYEISGEYCQLTVERLRQQVLL